MYLRDLNHILKKGVDSLKTFYVGNIEWSTTVEELEALFSPYGIVTKVEIKKDFNTGKSRGYGFITMENADKAMKEINGKEFKGRNLKINDAHKREDFNRREYDPRPYKLPRPKEPMTRERMFENSSPRGNKRYPEKRPYYPQKEFRPITADDVCFY